MESTFTMIGAFVTFCLCCFVAAMAIQTVINTSDIKKIKEVLEFEQKDINEIVDKLTEELNRDGNNEKNNTKSE